MKQSFDGTESLTFQHDDEKQFDPVWSLYPNEKCSFVPLYDGKPFTSESGGTTYEVFLYDGDPPVDVFDCLTEVRNARELRLQAGQSAAVQSVNETVPF